MSNNIDKRVRQALDIMDVDKRGVRLSDGPQYINKIGDNYRVWNDRSKDYEDSTDIQSTSCDEEEIKERVVFHLKNNLGVHEVRIPSLSKLEKDSRKILDSVIIDEL